MTLENLQKFYNNKTIFLTGHTGFKGAWMVLLLKKLGAKVHCYSLPAVDERGNMFNIIDLVKNCESSIIGDINDKNLLEKAILAANPDMIFHLAAEAFVLRSYQEPLQTMQTNIIGTTNLFEIARTNNTKVKSIINVTSDKCYENKEWVWPYRENDAFGGFDPYSASKGMCEILTSCYRRSYFDKMGIALASGRAGNVIGGGDFGQNRIIPDLIENIEKNSILEIRSPAAIRPWQHVLDVLYGYLLIGKNSFEDIKYAEGYNFAPLVEKDITVLELVENVSKFLGSNQFKAVEPKDKPHEAHLLKLDSTKARNELHWKNNLDFIETCEFTANWYKEYLAKGDMKSFTGKQIDQYLAKI